MIKPMRRTRPLPLKSRRYMIKVSYQDKLQKHGSSKIQRSRSASREKPSLRSFLMIICWRTSPMSESCLATTWREWHRDSRLGRSRYETNSSQHTKGIVFSDFECRISQCRRYCQRNTRWLPDSRVSIPVEICLRLYSASIVTQWISLLYHRACGYRIYYCCRR